MKKRYFVGLLLAAAVWWLLPVPIDRTPYQRSEAYAANRRAVAAGAKTIRDHWQEGEPLRVGWAAANLTPKDPLPLAGYGKRLGRPYTSVHDSVYVRAFYLTNGRWRVAVLTFDLLIVPMTLREALYTRWRAEGWPVDQLYLMATHTHHGTGGWAKRPGGAVLAGRYQQAVVDSLADASARALLAAQALAAPAEVAYAAVPAPDLVRNRVLDNGAVDTTLRALFFRQRTGATAALATFAAHATGLSTKEYRLSRGYPGALVDSATGYFDFVAFAAGAVGSHAMRTPYTKGFVQTAWLGGQLARRLRAAADTVKYAPVVRLAGAEIPLSFGEPQWRVARDRALRPALFRFVLGEYPTYLSALKIGPVTLVGTPADFSGELAVALYEESDGDPLVITSFNGGYVGYLTPAQRYDLDHAEVRDMNFTGPHSGEMARNLVEELQHRLPPLKRGDTASDTQPAPPAVVKESRTQ